MPLTADEMVKLCKAIFYCGEATYSLNRGPTIRKDVVFTLLNDYSPHMEVKVEEVFDEDERMLYSLTIKPRSRSSDGQSA